MEILKLDDLDRLIDGLSDKDKEELAARLFKKLSIDARARVLGLSDSGLTIASGCVVCLNSEIAINIQNSQDFDPEKLILALLEFRRRNSQV